MRVKFRFYICGSKWFAVNDGIREATDGRRILIKMYFISLYLGIHSCKELHLRSHRFALQNFQQVISTEEFLLLGFNEVINCCYISRLVFGEFFYVYLFPSHITVIKHQLMISDLLYIALSLLSIFYIYLSHYYYIHLEPFIFLNVALCSSSKNLFRKLRFLVDFRRRWIILNYKLNPYLQIIYFYKKLSLLAIKCMVTKIYGYYL